MAETLRQIYLSFFFRSGLKLEQLKLLVQEEVEVAFSFLWV
jgi:hypothetical protein